MLQTHIWQEYLDLVEQLRKTEVGKEVYAQRKETVERVFADAKEKHAMRYTHHRGLARVTNWVRLKYAAMNLKKLANWSWKTPVFSLKFRYFQTLLPVETEILHSVVYFRRVFPLPWVAFWCANSVYYG